MKELRYAVICVDDDPMILQVLAFQLDKILNNKSILIEFYTNPNDALLDIDTLIDEEIDIIDIFRPSDQILPFIQEAIEKKPKVIWLQEGIHNSEAEALATQSGIKVIFNRCMLAEHRRLSQ